MVSSLEKLNNKLKNVELEREKQNGKEEEK
jgi:hypothetical protein